jgi:hypothetical protein
MDRRKKLIAGAVAVAAFAGGSAALAADQLGFQERQTAVIEDAAERLGVESSELSDALEGALADQIDEAVAAGRLTEEQGAEMKQRLADGDAPLLALPGGPGGHRGGFGHFGGLEAAASYLGLTEAELREELADGTTLAEVAKAEGKTATGLVEAMVAAAKEKLAEAVADGRLTAEQQAEIVADLPDRIEAQVNGELPSGPRGHGPGGMGFGGPPPFDAPSEESDDAGTDA